MPHSRPYCEKRKEANRKWRSANRGKLRVSLRKWRAANPDKATAIEKKWRAANKEKRAVYQKQWAADNPEKARAASARYRKANRAKVAVYAKKYHERNPEVRKKWREDNRWRTCAYTAVRKASKLQATPLWVDGKALKDFYIRAAKEGLTVDHIVPLKHPRVCGLHIPWNLQLLSLSENSKKNNRFDIR